MAAILNSAILDSAILYKTLTQTNSIWLKLIHSDSTWWWQPSWILPSWIQPFCTKKTSLIHGDSTWWWQPSWILPCWIQILPSRHLSFSSQTHSHLPRIGSHHLHKKTFTHSLWLNLMMATILNSAMLDSDTLLSSLRFTPKHSHSTLTLTQTNSIWLKLIHSHSTWWWQPSWILPSWIQPSYFSSQTHSHLPRLVPTICTKKNFTRTSLPTICTTKNHSFILTQLDDGSHLEFSHLEFCHVGFRHCHLGILVFPLKLTHTCQDWFPPFALKNLHSFILTQLDGGSHLEFCHVGFRHCHLESRHLVFFSQIHSKTLSLHSDSDSN